jgi:putative FmdB family regulatory protein
VVGLTDARRPVNQRAVPIYEYECEKCKKHFEYMQGISESPKKKCEKCGGKLAKLISAAGFVLKGGGWYKDLYASSKSDSKSSDGESSSGGSSASLPKSESKSEAKAEKADKPKPAEKKPAKKQSSKGR